MNNGGVQVAATVWLHACSCQSSHHCIYTVYTWEAWIKTSKIFNATMTRWDVFKKYKFKVIIDHCL